MDLADIRQAIDGIDTTLLNSFVERMDIATEVAKSKIEMGKAVFDPARERSKLNNLASRAPERYEAQTITLFRLLMSMSKAEQQRYINELKGITVSQKAHATAAASDTPFPQTATVACQGVEGAYSQIAACKLFDVPDIAFFETFEGVMRAIRDGFCEFGVLPIENSTAGSVNAVYDLLAQFDFHIVRSLRLKIDHNLLVKPGTKLADIREVYSHGQAMPSVPALSSPTTCTPPSTQTRPCRPRWSPTPSAPTSPPSPRAAVPRCMAWRCWSPTFRTRTTTTRALSSSAASRASTPAPTVPRS